MQFKDYYATLGVQKSATEKEVKQAFRKLARKFHPDVNPGDEAAESKFKELNEANEVLSDPEKRRKYDELGSNWRAYEPGGGPGAQAGRHPGAGGSRTMSPDEMNTMFGEGDPFSDFFHTFFGGATSVDLYLRIRITPHPTFERRGKDLYTKIQIPLTTAVLGGEAEVPTLAGKPLRLKVPGTTQNGQTFRLKGHGMPTTNRPESGDLYATAEVQLPKALTPEQRTHFEALAELDKGTTS